MKHRKFIAVVILVALAAFPAFGGTSKLIENGDGTATLTITYQTYNWLEVCHAFEPSAKACADDTGGSQWAVDNSHCTQQEADDGVLISDATAYSPSTCQGGHITNNRCRDASDPLADQTGYTLESLTVCRDWIQAITTHRLRIWRNSGYRIIERNNVVRDEPSGDID